MSNSVQQLCTILPNSLWYARIVSPPSNVDRLLRELTSLSDRSDDEAKKKRRMLWNELIATFRNSDEREAVAFLSAELQLQPITVKRWIAGEFNPRHVHISR